MQCLSHFFSPIIELYSKIESILNHGSLVPWFSRYWYHAKEESVHCTNFRSKVVVRKEPKLTEAIVQLHEEGFVVTGIVSDDLRVQVDSILEISREDHFLFHISCGNHSIHNAIRDAFESNAELGTMLNNLEKFTTLMNRKDILSKIQTAVPKRCINRWTKVV